MNKDAIKEIDRLILVRREDDKHYSSRMAGMLRDAMRWAYVDAINTCKSIGPAHTYASENAEVYRAYDNGVSRCIELIEQRIGLIPADHDWPMQLDSAAR